MFRVIRCAVVFLAQTTFLIPSSVLAESGRGSSVLPAFTENFDVRVSSVLDSAKGSWLALLCLGEACRLEPVGLSDSFTECGGARHLFIRPKQKRDLRKQSFIALVSGVSASSGNVKTAYHMFMPRRLKDVANGSLGIALHIPGMSEARFIPRWDSNARNKFLTAYLETSDRRQVIGTIPFELLEQGVRPNQLVLWAGDMDGDSQIDLITQLIPNAAGIGGTYLWLSGRAKSGELVGLTASAEVQDECEGEEG